MTRRNAWVASCSRAMLRAAVFSLASLPVFALAQGVLVVTGSGPPIRLPRPIPPAPTPPAHCYKIKEIDVHARLAGQVAQVQVSQSFVNTGSQPLEVSFIFPLPYDGAIDRLTLLIDGKEVPAQLLPKDEARRKYEEIVRRNQDPALLEWLGSGFFQTSVFPVPPGAERKITLRYSQLCRQDHGLTDFLFPLSTAKYTSQPVEKVNIELAIESPADIKNVYSPTHTVDIQRPDAKHAVVRFKAENQVPSSDFRLLYDVGAGQVGMSLVSYRPSEGDEGFFLLLASPEIKAATSEHASKTVVFVVDRSGSMSGEKIEQAKGALRFVLNNLREGDLFNIVAYDSEIQSFRPELQKFDAETRQAALGFVEGLYAGGSTNIEGALATALGQLQDSSRPTYVLFLTDGLPTAGEQNETKLVVGAQGANKVRARIFAFGVGYDVNSRLLDKLVRGNFGQSEYVRPNENIEASVSRLYARVESPVLTDVALAFEFDGAKPEEGPQVTRIYPAGAFDLFEGEQMVVVARYKRAGAVKIRATGRIAGAEQKFEFAAELAQRTTDDNYGFVEKLWAVRRVGEILDQLDLQGKNEELIKELVALSTRHGILTPYTSFLADENVQLGAVTANAAVASENLGRLAETSGQAAFSQRLSKGDLQKARSAPAAGGARYRSFDGQEVLLEDCVQNVGTKCFFKRENRWVDSTVTEEQIAKAVKVRQFSDEYFALAEKHGRTMSQYLVFDEPALVLIDNQCYLIEK
ncbi:MAG: VWA domain-containing protein [Pirellulales bacterium]|nr:VWA domain-containing protein [Pirellulales bacterium]